jgi:uncharacterized protein DUF6011
MSTQTIERNYRKNPHTASFLQVFHTATSSTTGRNYREEMNVTSTDTDDLLNLVPAQAPSYQPSKPQVDLIAKLILEIHALDAELGSQAGTYTAAMDREGAWTRENTSRWIGNLIKKSRELTQAAKSKAPAAEVADGRYAVEEDGVLKFFKVKNGNRPGFVFLDIQASDDWHAIRDLGRIRRIVALIAQDAHAAMIRYGHELGECGRCGRTLTDEASRAAGIGPICQGK